MKFSKKIVLASATVLSALPFTITQADDDVSWVARSVDEIKQEITKEENQQTYTVKYGDTLSTIAEALNVDVNVLANLNKIANMDLIFPETVLKTEVNAQNEVTSVEIQAPQATATEEPVTATADLSNNEVKVADQVIEVEDLTKPAVEESQLVPTVPQEPVENVEQAPGAPTEVVETQDEPKQEVAPAPVVEAPASETSAPTVVPEPGSAVTEVEATPVAETAPATVDQTYSAPAETVAPDYGTIAAQNAANAGLQPQTASFKEEVAALFGITEFSGYRAGDSGDHGKGLAIDFMVPVGSDLGDQIAQYAIDNMDRAGISYIIWEQKFYAPVNNIYGPANTWNPMPDRGSVTENHYDHVHVSFN